MKRPTAMLCNRRRTTFRTLGQYKVITIYQWFNSAGRDEKVARRIITKNSDGTYYWIATILWSPDRYVSRTTKRGATASLYAAGVSGATDG